MEFRWRADDECWLGSFVILQGFRISIAKEPYSFVIYKGGGWRDVGVREPLSPSRPELPRFFALDFGLGVNVM